MADKDINLTITRVHYFKALGEMEQDEHQENLHLYCPIAQAMKERFPGDDISVALDGAYRNMTDENETWYGLDDQADKIVNQFDDGVLTEDYLPKDIVLLHKRYKEDE